MAFCILEAPEKSFYVTTDRPLVQYSFTSGLGLGGGWGNQDTFAILPLNPKQLLIIYHGNTRSISQIVLSNQDVLLFNHNIMKYAVHEVYSSYAFNHAFDWMLNRGIWKTNKVK